MTQLSLTRPLSFLSTLDTWTYRKIHETIPPFNNIYKNCCDLIAENYLYWSIIYSRQQRIHRYNFHINAINFFSRARLSSPSLKTYHCFRAATEINLSTKFIISTAKKLKFWRYGVYTFCFKKVRHSSFDKLENVEGECSSTSTLSCFSFNDSPGACSEKQ